MGRSVYCVVTAAGSGSRLGNPGPKALVEFAGNTLLHHALRSLEPLDDLVGVVITAPPDYISAFTEIARNAHLTYPWEVVSGGTIRQVSVYQGLQGLLTFDTNAGQVAADDPEAIVLIHDAARALTPRDQFQRVCSAVASGCPAVVPATTLVDTVREIAGDPFYREGVEITPSGATPDRSRLRCVQTPQGFAGNVIFAAHEQARQETFSEGGALDDALLAARLGYQQYFVAGSRRALKITYPLDLQLATWLAEDPNRE